VFLSFADTQHLRFVNGINLVGRLSLLGEYRLECFYKFVIDMDISKVTLKFTHESSCYRPQFPVCLQCLLVVLWVIAETLVTIDSL
jgi:hypothetical protein